MRDERWASECVTTQGPECQWQWDGRVGNGRDGRGKLSGVRSSTEVEPCQAGHASAAASTRTEARPRRHQDRASSTILEL
jgi:hypothetical protein